MKKLIAFILFILPFFANAQELPSKVKQSTWYKIMSNDSSYNYLVAEAEFQEFFTAHQQQKQRNAAQTNRNEQSAEEQHLKDPVESLIANYAEWSISIQPFVLKDGSIMPLKERLKIVSDVKLAQQSQK